VRDSSPPAEHASPDFNRFKSLCDNARWLFRLLNEHQFPATWFISESATEIVCSHLLSAVVPHEVGIWVDAGDSVGRMAFAREIDRQLFAMRQGGNRVSSIAGSPAAIRHVDLLLKRGIRALYPVELPDSIPRRTMSWHDVEAPRFGIWSLPPTLSIEAAGPLIQWVFRRRARRQISDVAGGARFSHLTVQLERVGERSVRRTLRSVIAAASVLREKGSLETRALSGVVELLTARPAARSAHSILRAA
jgi:hypothetical protein